ncbi:hypothetical protein F5Y16DRAFT_393972 [Xylariaceae sp. FL0255]|nr:hypothetical protein F5Y16DRAFT_393972 [Xylariaceae sp. FL0255]
MNVGDGFTNSFTLRNLQRGTRPINRPPPGSLAGLFGTLSLYRNASARSNARRQFVSRGTQTALPLDREDRLEEGDEDEMDIDTPDGPGQDIGGENLGPDDAFDPDNDELPDLPPATVGLDTNRTTIGYEFEFLMAAASLELPPRNSHPNDPRWDSRPIRAERLKDEGLGYNHRAIAVTCRNKMIDELRKQGISANYTNNPELGDGSNAIPQNETMYDDEHPDQNPAYWEYDYFDSLEDETDPLREPLSVMISNWVGDVTVDGDEDDIKTAVADLINQLTSYIREGPHEPSLTRYTAMANLDVWDMIKGSASEETCDQIAEDRNYVRGNHKMIDPSCATILGPNSEYYAWRCIDDVTIKIPETLVNDAGETVDCLKHYVCFNPELLSPILDFGHAQTHTTLRNVCGTLRNQIRIFKPHSDPDTTIHVHVGLEQGWTLLHCKKFSTMFLLLESTLSRLHTRALSQSEWCSPIRAHGVANYIYTKDPHMRVCAAHTIEPDRSRYFRQLERHVPLEDVANTEEKELIQNIWQFDDLEDLTDNFGCRTMQANKATIRMRLVGGKRSRRGTLDPDHIWRWTKLCVQLVHYTRDSTRDQFKATIGKMLREEPYPELGWDQDDLAWFARQQTDFDDGDPSKKGFFQYPSFTWEDPFMPPGAGEVM